MVRLRVSFALRVLGKFPSPVMILASKESCASANEGASGTVGPFCSIASLNGFWLRGSTTTLKVSVLPSKYCDNGNRAKRRKSGGIRVPPSCNLALFLPRRAEINVDHQ